MSTNIVLSPLQLRNIALPNRIIRSATYEGLGDAQDNPRPELADLYCALARGEVGAIITGFAYVSRAGRAMQPRQCGIESDARILPWRKIVEQVRTASPDVKLFMQLVHTGRQTRRAATGLPVVGASALRCSYFRQPVRALDEDGIREIIAAFAAAARRAQKAGFDGVQVHAAHGYLIHQFLSPRTNTRTDRWADGPLFLLEVIRAIRQACGEDLPVLVKISAADDTGLRLEDTIATVKRLDVDAVEISYGSMEYALNIIRGAIPVDVVLKVNPLYNRIPRPLQHLWKATCYPAYRRHFFPFSENYNAEAAARIKRETGLPVIAVGGIRTLDGMTECLTTHGLDAISLSRPLIREPDIPRRIREGAFTRSRCTNCNLCTVYCDSDRPVRCYAAGEREWVAWEEWGVRLSC